MRAYVSCQGYDGILQSAHFVNQGGTADVKEQDFDNTPVLDKVVIRCHGRIFYFTGLFL